MTCKSLGCRKGEMFADPMLRSFYCEEHACARCSGSGRVGRNMVFIHCDGCGGSGGKRKKVRFSGLSK